MNIAKKFPQLKLVIITFSLFLVSTYHDGNSQTYRDSTASIDDKVEDLLSRMTLDEKIGQMTQIDRSYIIGRESDIATYFLGSLLSGCGGTTDGINQGNTEVDTATLWDIHLQGYISAIGEGVGSVMASHSSWNGENCHGNHYLLTEVLKEELGFEGFVVSDWGGIDLLPGDYPSDIETAIC
ncbi:MAG: hypothetical protein DRI97_13155 [Bacteroidetes bacterium]|nr:MAG: hypothetical protein DRG83_04080 [Deltaproteobacteria bacterium]RLD53598.1 MAG: hypothetical protein DRI97_13155 [Bacteroidota bacterium]